MVFVVAECGVNWRDKNEAFKLIQIMKEVGADAVKFQMYQEKHVAQHPRADELIKIIFTPELAREFKDYADSIGIEIFWTPFYTEAVDVLEKLGMNRYKIRAKDATNTTLIRKVLNTNKKTYVSVAKDRVDWNAFTIPDGKDYKYLVELLWCVERYPAQDDEVHLNTPFPALRRFIVSPEYTGISDHTVGITCAIAAAAMGAKVIEKHVMLDNAFNWIDKDVSLNPKEFEEMVKHIRRVEKLKV